MYDAPENGFAWIETVKGTDYYLVRTGGRDLFRSWLAVHNPTTDETKCLNYADWDVNYGTNVRVNAADEAASVVNPTTGGARLIGTGDGSGGKNPLLGDPVANEEAQVKDGVW